MSAVEIALSWSGGKDSALALRALHTAPGPDVGALITTVTTEYERISMHGVRRELLVAQAGAAGVPLVEIEIPAGCSNELYEQRMGQALARSPLSEAPAIAFGDLFLSDIRAYREERLGRVGKEAVFSPLGPRHQAPRRGVHRGRLPGLSRLRRPGPARRFVRGAGV